jgi:hypothetical protein
MYSTVFELPSFEYLKTMVQVLQQEPLPDNVLSIWCYEHYLSTDIFDALIEKIGKLYA